MKIYLLTEGSYSDYRVVGAYTDKEKLEEFIYIYGDMYNPIEEYELDDYPDNPTYNMLKKLLDKGYNCYYVVMEKNGNSICNLIKERRNYFKLRYEITDYGKYNSGDVRLIVELWAKSEEQAVKVSNEIRTRILAENKWDRMFNAPQSFTEEDLNGD